MYNNGFSNGNTNSNERGIYSGISIKINYNTGITVCRDFCTHDNATYSSPVSTDESANSIYLKYTINNDFMFRCGYKLNINENTEEDSDFKTKKKIEEKREFIDLRWEKKSEKFSHSIGLTSSLFKGSENDKGFLTFYQTKISISEFFSVYFRYSVFECNYNSRIYSYENDIFQSFSIPFYSGQGSSFFILLNKKINKIIDIQSRFRIVYNNDQQNEYSKTNKDRELKILFRIKF